VNTKRPVLSLSLSRSFFSTNLSFLWQTRESLASARYPKPRIIHGARNERERERERERGEEEGT
jgi:hypothetical protein